MQHAVSTVGTLALLGICALIAYPCIADAQSRKTKEYELKLFPRVAGFQSTVKDINDCGEALVQLEDTQDIGIAKVIVWNVLTDEQRELPLFGSALGLEGRRIANDGTVYGAALLVKSDQSFPLHAFEYNPSTGGKILESDISRVTGIVDAELSSWITATSVDGEVCGTGLHNDRVGNGDNDYYVGFCRNRTGEYRALPTLFYPTAIDKNIVVGRNDTKGSYLLGSKITSIPAPEPFASFHPAAITRNTIVGFAESETWDSSDVAALHDLSTHKTTILGTLPGHNTSQARDVNRNGTVVGVSEDSQTRTNGTSSPDNIERAFVYQASRGIRDLNKLTRIKRGQIRFLAEANTINRSGFIGGTASAKSKKIVSTRAFIAIPNQWESKAPRSCGAVNQNATTHR